MSGRGGNRNPTKPWVDVGLLYECLKKHGAMVKNLGSYEHINSCSAPNAKALVDLQPLWSDLVKLEPSGMIHAQPLRQALLSLLVEMPELNASDHSGQVWCNLKVERLNCLLTHCRKLQGDTSSLTAVAGKLTRLQYQALMEGLEKLKVSNDKAGSKKMLGKAEAANRQLVPRDSDATMGSDDTIPDMFKSPKVKKGRSGLERPSPSGTSGLEKSPASTPKLVSQARPGSRLHEAMGYDLGKSKKKAKAKPVLKKPAACLGKGPLKKPAASLGKDSLGKGTSSERKPWVKLRQTDAKKDNPRSYICGMVEGGKMHLIVEISAKMSPHYKALIGKIREALEKDNLSKEEALSMRAKLLKQYGGL